MEPHDLTAVVCLQYDPAASAVVFFMVILILTSRALSRPVLSPTAFCLALMNISPRRNTTPGSTMSTSWLIVSGWRSLDKIRCRQSRNQAIQCEFAESEDALARNFSQRQAFSRSVRAAGHVLIGIIPVRQSRGVFY